MKFDKLKLPLAVFSFLFIQVTAHSQHTYYQDLNGKIIDNSSKTGIEGANLLIKNDSLERGSSTQADGTFEIKGLPTGRYRLLVSHVGYDSKAVNDILIESGKLKHLTVTLNPASKTLREVTIQDKSYSQQEYGEPSSYEFSIEQSQRFAATFYDPGRMTLSYPGVTSSNDQANNISIRGNAPYTNTWRLQGADIVNPNHLTNAGTLTDRISVVGGGVSILSAQLMDNSRLLTGAFPASYGDALGGFLDIKLRDGNHYENEYTLQAGLLGLDLAAEGPLSKNSNASFLVNYRYSTIGLLETIGIPVSDESINFQDLSFNVSFPSGKKSTWNVFGMFGISKETFEVDQDTSTWEMDEDRVDTEFSSDMGAIGVSNKTVLNSNTSINSVATLSQINTDRKGYFVESNFDRRFIQNDIYSEGILSINSTIHHKTNNNNAISGGITVNHNYFDLLSQEAPTVDESFETLVQQNDSYQIFKAFAEYKPFITERFKTSIGLHALYFNLNDEISIEPRIGLTYLSGSRSKIDFRYGLVSQSHFPQVYFVIGDNDNTASYPNRDLNLSKSHQFNLAYTYDVNSLTTIKLESYYQQHFNIPVSSDLESSFSLINAVDAFINEELVNEGKGTNKGVELLIDRDFNNGYYFLFSSAIYDSKYKAIDGQNRSTRYDGDYAFSLTGGKEIHRFTKNKNRIFGVNVRAFWHGGYRYTPIDLAASRSAGQTVYEDNAAFSKQLTDFIKADLRIYFKKNKEKYTRTLAIDIQNVTGRENEAYQYYDVFADKVITKKQLGIIPFISYRVEF